MAVNKRSTKRKRLASRKRIEVTKKEIENRTRNRGNKHVFITVNAEKTR